jgi:hypothetical protein
VPLPHALPVAGHCDVEEPLLEPKEGGNIAACHYPLADGEIAGRRFGETPETPETAEPAAS